MEAVIFAAVAPPLVEVAAVGVVAGLWQLAHWVAYVFATGVTVPKRVEIKSI
jgi:hypothetical protein